MKIRSKEIMKVALVIIYLILTTTGLILMKKGGNSGNIGFAGSELNFNISLISLLGFICYICSFLLFTRLVIMFDLSYIIPLCAAITQILALIAAKVIFKEEISTTSLIGVVVIIIGIVLMNIKK